MKLLVHFYHSLMIYSLKLNNNAGHVVAADPAGRCNICSYDPFEDVFNCLRDLLFLFIIQEVSHSLDSLLRSEAVPDAVAGNYKESCTVSLFSLDLGDCCDHLLISLQLRVGLVLEVAERAGKVQYALHTVIFDEAACSLDSRLLGCQVGLVILTEGDCYKFPTCCLGLAGEDCSGIP